MDVQRVGDGHLDEDEVERERQADEQGRHQGAQRVAVDGVDQPLDFVIERQRWRFGVDPPQQGDGVGPAGDEEGHGNADGGDDDERPQGPGQVNVGGVGRGVPQQGGDGDERRADQAGDALHQHRTERLGAVAVALAQGDDLDQIAAEAGGDEVVGEETDVVEVDQIAETRLIVQGAQQDVPAVGADDDVELEQQEGQSVPVPVDARQRGHDLSQADTAEQPDEQDNAESDLGEANQLFAVGAEEVGHERRL